MRDKKVIEICAREPEHLRLADCKNCQHYYPKIKITRNKFKS